MHIRLPWTLPLLALVACGGSTDPIASSPSSSPDAASPRPGADAAGQTAPDGAVLPISQSLLVDPPNPTLGVDSGASDATLPFRLLDQGAAVAGAQFSLEDETLGTIDRTTGVFTAKGTAGRVIVYATTPNGYASTTLTVVLRSQVDGDPDRDTIFRGAGGSGGVGGEGGGTPVGAGTVRDTLDGPAEVSPDLSWLYPYDQTVWPRGLPAPLLAWRSGALQVEAVKVHVEVDDTFFHTSYLGRPADLDAARNFTRVAMPAQVWRLGTQSGRTMRVSLTVAARDAQGVLRSYRPSADLTWTIAPGSLKGTVYYNSYGTALTYNALGARGAGDGRFGGAVLAVRGDSYEPRLVAGVTTTQPGGAEDRSGCRVCHTVSGDGSTMFAQALNMDAVSAKYDLRQDDPAGAVRPRTDDSKFVWSALSPDGSVAFASSGGDLRGAGPRSALYDTTSGAELTAEGLLPGVTQAAMPTFSPDGTRLAFNYVAGSAPQGLTANGASLALLDVAKRDATTYTFSNLRGLYTSPSGDPGWPTFLPGEGGVVFQRALGTGTGRFFTERGAEGELWWTDFAGHATPLARANGAGYLQRSASHPEDEVLNYEPAASPIVAGGYAWVIFTSRRSYADVATRPPYESDPWLYDTTPTSPSGPTTKKLWVAAVDVRAGSDVQDVSDPSHPAFYLPSQELYAGNSRGFWVPDVCREAGQSCASGDECCGGFCYGTDELGSPVCQVAPPPPSCKIKYVDEFGNERCYDPQPGAACSAEYDACQSDADCCNSASARCISGRCATLLR